MVILRTLLVCLIIALILWGIYAALRSILSNKWLHDKARQDVVHLFNQDLPKWLEAAYTALNQHLQTQGSKCDWSIEAIKLLGFAQKERVAENGLRRVLVLLVV